MTKSVAGSACKCPDEDPVTCVKDDEVVTQWSFKDTYTLKPRDSDEDLAVSVVRGAHSPAEAFEESTGKPPQSFQLKKLRARQAPVASIREAGLAVVHTPGWFEDSLHSSVVYPDTDPLRVQDAEWPEQVSNDFDDSFVKEGVLQHGTDALQG